MTTGTSERGPCGLGAGAAVKVTERPAVYGSGWICGAPGDTGREYWMQVAQLAVQNARTSREYPALLLGEISARRRADVSCDGLWRRPHVLERRPGETEA